MSDRDRGSHEITLCAVTTGRIVVVGVIVGVVFITEDSHVSVARFRLQKRL